MNIYIALGAALMVLGVLLFGMSGVKRLRSQGNMKLMGLALFCCVLATIVILNGINP